MDSTFHAFLNSPRYDTVFFVLCILVAVVVLGFIILRHKHRKDYEE